jgi:aryl-alcohol dehydrogenase-like predicted oxidoreductase
MLKQTKLAATGVSVSSLGLGTVKFGRNQKVHYPHAFDLPGDAAILDLLACAKDCGINLLDTAPAYGNSEERLGDLLKNQRKQWVLATKVGEEFVAGESIYDFSATHTIASVDRSLQRLQTDYLDIVLVHSNGEDTKIINENGILDTLATLKQAGKIRAFGMSTKTVEGGLLAVDAADIVMVMHNPIYIKEQAVLAHAYQRQKAIFIKKAFASGHLQKLPGDDPVREAMHFIFQEPAVSSIIVGTLNPEHLRHNVECAISALSQSA